MNFAGAIDYFTASLGPYVQLRDAEREWENIRVAAMVRRVAGGLAALGVKPGDRVAMVQPTSIEAAVGMWGIMRAGAIAVPLDFSLSTEELEDIFKDCRPFAVLAGPAYRAGVETALGGAALDSLVISAGTGPESGPSLWGFFENGAEDHPPAPREGTDIAAILYTSGSTGVPKGVMLTHENLLSKGAAQEYRRGQAPTPPTCATTPLTMLLFLPMSHVFGFIMLQMIWRTPIAVVFQERFRIDESLDLIERRRPVIVPAVPTVFSYILNHPGVDARDLSSVMLWISGGAALPLPVYDRWQDRFGRRIIQGYGLTEASASVSANLDPSGGKRGSIGRASPGVRVKVIGEDGRELEAGERGELCISGDGVMAGYYGKPELTGDVLRDGWLYTGDVGIIDEDGYIFIVDRIKDVIIRGGMNVYPREVEEALLKSADVREAAVIGVPDDVLGEVIVAFVTARAGRNIQPETLREESAGHLARYKTPQDIFVLDDMPRNALGKIMKKTLKRRHAQGEFACGR